MWNDSRSSAVTKEAGVGDQGSISKQEDSPENIAPSKKFWERSKHSRAEHRDGFTAHVYYKGDFDQKSEEKESEYAREGYQKDGEDYDQ